MCDLGKGESSGGVVRTLRGQPRSARWGRAAGRGSGGDGSPAPRRRRKAAHANPRGWGLKAGPRAPLGSRQGASCEAATWGGGGRGDEALPHPAPPRGGGGHGAAGPNPGQEVGARPSRLPQLLPQLLLPLPTPRPRASSYSASKRQQPRPERGQLRPCVMPPCVLWSRPQRREAWAALAGSPPLPCCLTAVSGCVSFCFSLC